MAFSQGQKTTLAALLGELFRGGHRFSSQGKTLATLAANRTLVISQMCDLIYDVINYSAVLRAKDLCLKLQYEQNKCHWYLYNLDWKCKES